MTLLFAFSNWTLCRVALAYASCGRRVGWLKLAGPLSLVGSLPAVIILSVLAITEIIFDKLPNTPNRTAPPGLIARIVTGGLTAHAFLLAVDSRLSLVLGWD